MHLSLHSLILREV